jgi:putative membrane protein
MNERQAQWFRQLQETQTPALASRFHDQQIQAHTQAIELFERAARELESEEMRNFAQQSLPHLRDHLALLRTHSHGTLP